MAASHPVTTGRSSPSESEQAAADSHHSAGTAPAPFPQSTTLKSRSYIGLVTSQFLAAFNDQASHIVAFFYATDMLVRYVNFPHLDTKAVVSIVTACFITPFFLFSPLAGVLADKYSKRSIIVAWKLAEVGIMALALVGFLLPHAAAFGLGSPRFLAAASSVLLMSIVFLMGTHSAFFIPAKYGMMPEILDTSILSRGNGLLEGSSFVANIMGTMIGGLLYGWVKSRVDITADANILHPGNEWIIGVLLLTLAVAGALASLVIERIPAAAPNKQLILEPWTPMKQNLGMLRRSRSLVLATVGIAFFLFMTLFLRQSLLFQGELNEEVAIAKKIPRPVAAHVREALSGVVPPQADDVNISDVVTADEEHPTPSSHATKTEFEVAFLIGIVGLGVGIGCSLAGYFSGNRIELGLVPIGIVLLIITTALMSLAVPAKIKMVSCLLAIGGAAGLYIVPLYTLLQHRSPKDSKGSLVATSNFFNVTGGLIAVIVFFVVTWSLQSLMKLNLNMETVRHAPDLVGAYLHQLDRAMQIPKLLFVFASLITLVMLALVWWNRPDFMLRAVSWMRSSQRRHLRTLGLDNVPFNGQVILVSNSHDFDHWICVVSSIDRFARFVAPQEGGGDMLLRGMALNSGVMIAAGPKVRLSPEDNALARGLVTLGQGNIVGISLAADYAADREQPGSGEHLLAALRAKVPANILPVYCGEHPTHPDAVRHPEKHTYVVIGEPMAPDTPLEQIRASVAALGN